MMTTNINNNSLKLKSCQTYIESIGKCIKVDIIIISIFIMALEDAKVRKTTHILTMEKTTRPGTYLSIDRGSRP